MGCAEQRHDEVGWIDATLVRRTEDAGEHLLAIGTACGAVAAAAHLARDDGGAQRVLRPPVGRVERRVEEKAEEGVEFDDEVLLKAPDLEPARRALKQTAQSLDVVAPRDREAVRGDEAGAVAIPSRQRRLENRFHRGDKRLSRIVEQQDAASPQQVGETRLMGRLFELPIRLPPVALQDAGIVDADHVRRLRQAPPGLNRIDGGLRRDKGPEPLQVGVHAPAGFIGGHDRTAADGRTERGIGRLRVPRGAMDRLHQPAARDGQPEAVAQQCGDLAVGTPKRLFRRTASATACGPHCTAAAPRASEVCRGCRPWTRRRHRGTGRSAHETRGRSAAGPAALLDIASRPARDAPSRDNADTPAATAPRRSHRCATASVGARANHRQRRASARPTRVGDARATRERRGLPRDGAARRLEFLFQFLVFATQSLALGFRPAQVLAQPLDLPPLIVNDLLGVARRRAVVALWHAPVMPDLRTEYKRKPLCLCVSVARDQREARVSMVLTR